MDVFRAGTRAQVATLPGVRHTKAWLARLEVSFGMAEPGRLRQRA